MSDDKQKLYNQFDSKKKEISELRAILNRVNEEKEKWFSEKDATGKEIKKLITQIKETKKRRDQLTAKVKESKQNKGKIILDIKKKIEEAKFFAQQKSDFFRKHKIKGDPLRLKRQIQSIETKIETEVMSFQQEQKLMKKIKDLRHKYGEFGELNKIVDSMNDISSEIDNLKVKERDLKKEIRKNARDSQKEHEQILETSKSIDELKVKEKEQYEKFTAAKREFSRANKRLKELLPELGELRSTVTEMTVKKKRDRELKEKQTLDQKRSRVDEKIKKGEKLTTEDLLVFQKEEQKD